MKDPTPLTSPRLSRILAGAALVAIAAAQLHAAPADAQAGGKGVAATPAGTAGEASEPGTIPAARPGLPQLRRGAEGPRRPDETPGKADPSLRDTHPLTINGLWETLPGNVIAKPLPAQ